MLNEIAELLVGNKAFQRERKKNRTRALAIALYYLGVSLRDTAEMVCNFEVVSHEAVRLWFQRFGTIRPVLEQKERKVVAIDETVLKIKKRWYYLWAAIDVDTKELLGIYLSPARTPLETISFVRYVMTFCKNKQVILVDGGPWYGWALTRMGLTWYHVTHGLRNAIEQWYAILKRRTRRFYNSFSTAKNTKSIIYWCKAFVNGYNLRLALS